MKTIITFLFLLCVSGIAFPQSAQDPVEAIKDLKEGVLVVRLRTFTNKINKLEEALASGNLSERARRDYKEELEETRTEVARENSQLRKAFENLYGFSDVLFLYDTLAPQLKSDRPSGIFLNEAGAIDPALVLEGPFLIAGIGLIAASEAASGNDALIIYDREFNAMGKPFPGYAGVSTARLLFRSFVSSSDEVQAFQLRIMVEKIDKKLSRYYWKQGR